MLENEFHKLEEKQEIRTTISQIRKEIKKQDSKKAFLELLQGKDQLPVLLGDVGDVRLCHRRPEQGHGDQVVHRPGRLAIAVDL